MNKEELKELYAKEPWGKLLIEMGMEPYDTESSARRVAEYAETKIEDKMIRLVDVMMEIVAGNISTGRARAILRKEKYPLSVWTKIIAPLNT